MTNRFWPAVRNGLAALLDAVVLILATESWLREHPYECAKLGIKFRY